MLGEPGQSAVELIVIGPIILHGAAGFVSDRHDAVHIGVIAEKSSLFDSVRNVLAGAGGAVDRADDGDVIACSESAVAAIEAHEVVRLGGGWRRRAIPAESI